MTGPSGAQDIQLYHFCIKGWTPWFKMKGYFSESPPQ